MLKIIGGVMLFLASVMIGAEKYSVLCERRHILSCAISGIKSVEGMIKCCYAPLDECFRQAGGIFYEASQYIEMGVTPAEAMIEASKKPSLTELDREAFAAFANGLNAADRDGQLSNAHLLETQLVSRIAEAENDIKTKGTLALKGSVLIGGAVVILLI